MKKHLTPVLAVLAALFVCLPHRSPALTTNFFASFETANGTSNATPAALNSGTAVGSWSFQNLPDGADGAGAISSNAANRAYTLAYRSTGVPGMQTMMLTNNFVNSGSYPTTYFYDAAGTNGTRVFAQLASAGTFTGTNQTLISFKWGAFATANSSLGKGQFVRGLDASGNEIFKLLFLAGNFSSNRIFYARGADETNITLINTSVGIPSGTPINPAGASSTTWASATVGADPSEYLQVTVLLTNSQVRYTVAHSGIAGSPVTTGFFPVNSSATNLARLEFSAMWSSTANSQFTGFWLDDLLVTDGPLPVPKNYLWQGNVTANWDVAVTTNWLDLGTALPSTYTEGASGGTTVIFDDSAATPFVNLVTTVAPNVIQFSNTTAYMLGGPGKISGTGTLVEFRRNGLVTISNANDFVGTANLLAGRVRLANNAGLGAGVINLGNGGLSSVGSTPRNLGLPTSLVGNPALGDATDNGLITFSSVINIGAAARNLTNQSDVRFAAGAIGTGANGAIVRKSGTGTLTVNGPFIGSGTLDIRAGALVLDGAAYTNSGALLPNAQAGAVARLALTNGAVVVLQTATTQNLMVGTNSATPGTNIVDLAGTWLMPAANSSNGEIRLETAGSLYSEFNLLTGGDIAVNAVTTSGGGGNPTRFNFSGGTLRAKRSNATFLQDLGAAYIQAGGAVIDTTNNNITIAQDLLDGGGGGLAKFGTGTLTLDSGNNTYTGATLIHQGTLNVRLPFGSTNVVPAVGTTLGFIAGTDSSASKTLSSLTLPGSNSLVFTCAPNSVTPAGALLTVPTITATGNVNLAVAGLWPTGTHTLLDYAGTSPTFVFGSLPAGVVGYLTNDLSATAVKLVVTYSAGQKTWYGFAATDVNGYGLWDVATSFNWNSGSEQYLDNGSYGDFVTFDSSVSPNFNVALAVNVAPVGVLVTNSSGGFSDFSFYGPGKITGSGSLTKILGGSLTLNMTNDYTGGTFLRQGAMILNTANALPVAGTLTLGMANAGANLVLNGFNQTLGGLVGEGVATSGFRRIYNGSSTAATLTLNIPDGVSCIYGNGLGRSDVTDGDNFSLVKNGGGVQQISTASYAGTTTVNGGRLNFAGNALALTNTVTVNSGATLGGNGQIDGPVVLNAGATLSPANNTNSPNTLVISNNLTMAGGSTNWFDVNRSTGNSDVVSNLVNVTYAGTLVVNSTTGSGFANGETYQFFHASGTVSGNFANVVVLPANGATGTFNPTNGTVTISVPPPPTITNGFISVSLTNEGQLIGAWGFDIKGINGYNVTPTYAQDLFVTDKMNVMRVPIWGTDDRPAHPAAGVVDGSHYADQLYAMTNARAANSNVIFFASKKLRGTSSFPAWTKDFSGVIASQYAILLADYLEYIYTNGGFTIEVLGIDNERYFNEGNITPSVYNSTINALRSLAVSRGFPLPKQFIGPENYYPDTPWLSSYLSSGGATNLDIVGTHYYPSMRGTFLSSLQTLVSLGGARPAWHSEVHWDNNIGDVIDNGEASLATVFDCTDTGMSRFIWWAYTRNGVKGQIEQAFSASTAETRPVTVTTPDNDGSTVTLGTLFARGFRSGTNMVVWVLNNTSNAYANCKLNVSGGSVTGSATLTSWDAFGATVSVTNAASATNFVVSFGPRTINQIQFSTAAPQPPAPVLSNAGVSGGTTFQFTVNGSPNVNYTVLGSTNLVNWSVLFTTNPPVMPVTLGVPFSGTNRQQFFRLQVEP